MAANRRDRVERTFEQMKGSVLRKVKNERYKELYDKYVKDVRGEYKIDTFEGELQDISVEPPRRMDLGASRPLGPGPGLAPATPKPKAPGE